MNPGIDYYMTSGLPATGQVTFNRMPNTLPISSATLTVTIGTNMYTWLPPGVTGNPDFVGATVFEMAKSLACAINAQQNRSDLLSNQPTANMLPIKSHYAMYFGATVAVIATIPGLAGNSLAFSFSSSDPGCATIANGATTLAGGNAQLSTLARNSKLLTSPGSAEGQVQVATVSTPFQTAFFYGIKALTQIASTAGYSATANAATVYIGEMVSGKINYVDPVATSLTPTPVSAPPGGYLDLINYWVLTPTGGDSAFVKWI
jgi:hypothetical protein